MIFNKIKFSVLIIYTFFFLIVISGAAYGTGSADPGINERSFKVSKEYDLQLTRKEKQWINAHPVIRARVGSAPPLHFFEGTFKGISVDYLNLIGKRVGVKIKYVSGIPWPQAMNHIKNHEKIDLILTATKTEEREKFVIFTDFYLVMPLVIFTPTTGDFVGGIEDLRKKTVSVEEGFVMYRKLKDGFPDIKLLVAKSSRHAIEAVASGRADAYIGNLTIASYIIQKNSLNNLKIAAPAPTPFGNHDQAMAIRNDWPELASIINKALASVTSEEHAAIRNRWLTVRYEYGISKVDILRWILPISIFLLAVAAVILYWNRKLKKEVIKRQKSEERFKTVFQTTPNAITLTTVEEGTYIDVNDGFTKMVGYSLKEVIGESSVGLNIWNHSNDRERLRSGLKKHGLVENLEAEFKAKDGQIITGLMSARLLKIENKDMLLAVTQDITEIKQAEEALLESEKKYRELSDSLPQVVFEIDVTGRILYINKNAFTLFGYEEDNVYHGTNIKQMIISQDHDRMFKNMQRILKGSHLGRKEYTARKHDGTTFPVVIYSNRVVQNTNPIGLRGILIDISERKKMEADLTQLALAIDHASDTIVITDTKGDIIYVNPAFEKITGYTQKEALEKNPRILQSGSHDHSFYKKLWERISSGKTWTGRFINKRKDGSEYTEDATISPVYSDKGKIINYVAVKRDISNTLKLENQLRQAQKMETIGTLAGGIAHDFNNILFPIVGHTEMMIEDVPEDSPLRNSLNEIYTSALRARDLVKQILTFSRQDTKELKLIKMSPIVIETLNLIRSLIPATIKIKQNIHSCSGVIKGDPTLIHQIVMNLTTNAYHAMEDTGGELLVSLKEVELKAFDLVNIEITPGVYAFLSIADTGIGMDKILMDKIFDPFFTTKKKGKGTGMGLSVVHGIIRSMNGAIRVYSEPGKGTQFHVYLPVEKSLSKEPVIHSKENIYGGTEQILLVDDEEAILIMEKQMLQRLGYQVASHTSSLKALEAFRDSPAEFDMVITDMAMPDMPGDKLSEELSKIRPDIPILLCTGFSEIMTEESAVSLGIKDFLLKPITMKDLSQKIRGVLDEK